MQTNFIRFGESVLLGGPAHATYSFAKLCWIINKCRFDGVTENMASPFLMSTLDEHSNTVWHVSWSHDGRYLASSSSDKSIKLWSQNSMGWNCIVCFIFTPFIVATIINKIKIFPPLSQMKWVSPIPSKKKVFKILE